MIGSSVKCTHLTIFVIFITAVSVASTCMPSVPETLQSALELHVFDMGVGTMRSVVGSACAPSTCVSSKATANK
jgi:hypothetical protein